LLEIDSQPVDLPPYYFPEYTTAELPSGDEMAFEMEGGVPQVEAVPDLESYSEDSIGLLTPESSVSPVSPISPHHLCYHTAGFDSPITPHDLATHIPWRAAIDVEPPPPRGNVSLTLTGSTDNFDLGNVQDSDTVSPATLKGKTRCVPSIRVDTSCSGAREVPEYAPPSMFDGTSSPQKNESPSPTSRTPISLPQQPIKVNKCAQKTEDLRDVFHALFRESMLKIAAPTVSPAASTLIHTSPTASSFFESGLAAVQKVLLGQLPTRFWEVYGVVHLAFSAALADGADVTDRFLEIYQDIMVWSRVIGDLQERANFVQLAAEVWCPVDEHTTVINPRPQKRVGRTRGSPLSATSSTSFAEQRVDSKTQNVGGGIHSTTDLLNTLKNGVSMRLCLQFLDGKSFRWGSIQN